MSYRLRPTALVVWGLLASCVRPAAASPLTPGTLLVSDLDTYVLTEFTRAGVPIQTFTFPDFTGGHRELRDVIVSADATDVHAYNGTFTPQLSTLVPATGVITSRPFAGWSTVSNATYGGIGAVGDGVFVTDMNTANGGEPVGIVRFSTTGGPTVRFGSREYSDLTVGGDGLIYALNTASGPQLDVYDSTNDALVRTVTLNLGSVDIRGFAVAATGAIYAAEFGGTVYAVDRNGRVLNSRDTGDPQLADIDLDNNGVLAIGTARGTVILTDTSLASQTSFTAGSSIATEHVAFSTPLVLPEPSVGSLFVALTFSRVRTRRRPPRLD
jgi:hypothetical protein